MENKAHFGSLTDRMSAFREEVLMRNPISMLRGHCWRLRPIKRIRISPVSW